MVIKIIRKKPVDAAPVPDQLVEKQKPGATLALYATGKSDRKQAHCDGQYRIVRKDHPNVVVSWFLMASYLYYHHNVALVTDALYDEMAQDMKSRWNSLRHPHLELISEDDLDAGTMYNLPAASYPLSCRAAAKSCVVSAWGLHIDIDSH